MADGKKTPVIRLAGYNDDWEQRKLESVVNSVDTGKSKFDKEGSSGEYPILGSTSVIGYDNEYDYEGDFILTARVGANAGSLYRHAGKVKISDNTVFIQASQNIEFLYHLLTQFDIKKLSFGTGQPLVKASELKNIELIMPTDIKEQMRIGEYFKSLDNLITLHQRKYDSLVTIKKSMLEKLFPKERSIDPEVRFSGFTDPWKQRKLGEIFEEYSEKGHAEFPPLTIIQGGGTIRRDESDRNLQYDTASLSSYKLVNEGDFIVHLRSFEGGLERATTTGIISPAYHTFHGEGTDSRFYYQYFRSPKFINIDLKPHVYGIRDGRSIDIDGMKTIKIPWTSLEEQRTIGTYIDTIDTLITFYKRKSEKLKNIKKALLDKMFV